MLYHYVYSRMLHIILYMQPTYYVSHLIGHEGPGSLLSYLKARGWCRNLGAGQRGGAKGFSFFSISMDMTVAGEGGH